MMGFFIIASFSLLPSAAASQGNGVAQDVSDGITKVGNTLVKIEGEVATNEGKALETELKDSKLAEAGLHKVIDALKKLQRDFKTHVANYRDLVNSVVLAEHAGNRQPGDGAQGAHNFIIRLQLLDSEFASVIVNVGESLNGLKSENVELSTEAREEVNVLKDRGYKSHQQLMDKLVKLLHATPPQATDPAPREVSTELSGASPTSEQGTDGSGTLSPTVIGLGGQSLGAGRPFQAPSVDPSTSLRSDGPPFS